MAHTLHGVSSTIWHQFPCRLRVYATQIEEASDAGSPEEYGVGPAELHALQDMAAKWWQDVQYDRQKLDPEGVAGRGQRLQVDTAGRLKFSRGNGGAKGPTKGPQCGGTQEGTCTCSPPPQASGYCAER